MNAGILESTTAPRPTLVFFSALQTFQVHDNLMKQSLHVATLPVKMSKVSFGNATSTVKNTKSGILSLITRPY